MQTLFTCFLCGISNSHIFLPKQFCVLKCSQWPNSFRKSILYFLHCVAGSPFRGGRLVRRICGVCPTPRYLIKSIFFSHLLLVYIILILTSKCYWAKWKLEIMKVVLKSNDLRENCYTTGFSDGIMMTFLKQSA